MFSLANKTALITGAATRLGQAIALALARAGARVAIADKVLNSLAETQSLLSGAGSEGFPITIDVRNVQAIEPAVDQVERGLGAIDILVNNAGNNHPAPALEVTLENWEEHFQTNVRGGFFLAQAVAPGMISRKWGRIIFISSQSGLIGIPGQPVYCSTKGAVIQLVRTLGVEWARYGITVNSIAPTFVETNMTRARLQQSKFREFVLGRIPRGELAHPEHIAAAAVYLASEEATMVNCHTHCVDGGWTAW